MATSTIHDPAPTNRSITSDFFESYGTESGQYITARKCGRVISLNIMGDSISHAEGDVLFTIAEKYRPITRFDVVGCMANAFVVLRINTDGKVVIWVLEKPNTTGRIYANVTYFTA